MTTHPTIKNLGLPTQFPDFFPADLERYRHVLAESIDAPDEYAVAYMLTIAATAAGANVSACVQSDWCVKANLFMALIGHKGTGKSPLAKRLLGPLVAHEEELRQRFADEAAAATERVQAGRLAVTSAPQVIVNDCTGPAIAKLLVDNDRQLLVNPDELSAQFIRNTGGTDRQMWCELYDGRRLSRARASAGGSSTLTDPYVCVLGGMQPDLFRCAYGKRGDDGLLDRYLLVGDGIVREARWPKETTDPSLQRSWDNTIRRLLRVEELASDVMGGLVEARFTSGAREVCQQFMNRLNDLITVIKVPDAQRGIVKKLSQHAVKLALLHRCLRWATGEFGDGGPFGDVDAADASAACDAALFFLGRWLIWRPELSVNYVAPGSGLTGPSIDHGDDPALKTLATTAESVQRSVYVIERVIRYCRYSASHTVSSSRDAGRGTFVGLDAEEVRNACEWLMQNGHGEWVDQDAGEYRLEALPVPVAGGRRRTQRRRLRTDDPVSKSNGALRP